MTASKCELCSDSGDTRAVEGVALCADKAACLGRVAARIQRNLAARIDRGMPQKAAATPRQNANEME